MAIAVVSPQDAARYRRLVRSRLSQRNILTAIAAVIGGCVTLVGAIYTRGTGHWPLFALLAGPATFALWDVHALIRPQVICPQCGDHWEYDGFLKATACETCGLPLPTGDLGSR